MTRPWFFLLAGGACLLALGCRSTGPKFDPTVRSATVLSNLTAVGTIDQIKPEWLKPPEEAFVLGPGDAIDIEVIGDIGSRSTVRLGPDGKVYYHLLAGLDLWGMTLAQARATLEKELARYFNQPQVLVTLRVVESKQIWIMGRVATPGIYPMTAPMTVLEAISLAGGAATTGAMTTEDLGDLRHSFVVRQGQVMPVDFYRLIREGDMRQNIYLQPDDFVFIPSALAQEIYVLGAVGRPRAVTYRDDITLVTAIAAAGGHQAMAYLSHVAIVRGSLTEPQIGVVDLDEILKGQAPDIRLEPRDIVYVPNTPYQFLMKYADMIVRMFVRTVAANEGIKAISPDRGGVEVTVPGF